MNNDRFRELAGNYSKELECNKDDYSKAPPEEERQAILAQLAYEDWQAEEQYQQMIEEDYYADILFEQLNTEQSEYYECEEIIICSCGCRIVDLLGHSYHDPKLFRDCLRYNFILYSRICSHCHRSITA